MAGLTVPLIDKPLLAAKTALNDVGVGAVDVAGCANLSFAIVGNGAVSAGAVQLEESHDVNFAGTWAALGTPSTPITVVGNGVVVMKYNNTAKAVRARISTAVTGGSVSVVLTGR
jgi:hypothetical protein